MSLAVAFLIAILVGIAMGLLNGILVAYGKMQGFVTTLATLSIGNGAALIVSEGAPVRCSNVAAVKAMASKDFGYPIVIGCVIIIIIIALVQKYTSYGRIVIACGSNSTAVTDCGYQCKEVCMLLLCSFRIPCFDCRNVYCVQNADRVIYAWKRRRGDAIAACVIGGASLAGGKGNVVKAVIGALIIALINNIMNLKGVPAYPQEIVKGCIIIAAVLLQIATDRARRGVMILGK